MEITEKISTDINNIVSCGVHVFARPWDEEDCRHLFQLLLDDAVKTSRSSAELERAVMDFGTTVNMMLMYFSKKDGEYAPF